MYDITKLRGEELRKVLTESWNKVVSERTPYQIFFFEYTDRYHTVYANSMKWTDEERVLAREIHEIENRKFFSNIGFDIGGYIKDTKGHIYYIYDSFGKVRYTGDFEGVSLSIVKVGKSFNKSKIRFVNCFSCYFELGRVLNGTNDSNFTYNYEPIDYQLSLF